MKKRFTEEQIIDMLGEANRYGVVIREVYLRSQDVIQTLSRLMRLYGKPAYMHSDSGAEVTATAVIKWLRDANIGPAFIESGKHCQNDSWRAFMTS